MKIPNDCLIPRLIISVPIPNQTKIGNRKILIVAALLINDENGVRDDETCYEACLHHRLSADDSHYVLLVQPVDPTKVGSGVPRRALSPIKHSFVLIEQKWIEKTYSAQWLTK